MKNPETHGEITNSAYHPAVGKSSSGLRKFLKRHIPNKFIHRLLPKKAGNSVLITFDDGPTKTVTPQVLDILDKYRVKAIFFAVGYRAEKNPDILKEIVNRGHMIGNHSYQHHNKALLRPVDYRHDIIKCQGIIEGIIGRKPKLFRPPGGNITIAGLISAKLVGLSSLFWSNDAGESSFNKGQNAKFIGDLIIAQLKPRDIILLHDDCESTPEILDLVLQHLSSNESISLDGLKYIKT